jgi:hypothetical protein
MLAQVSLMSRTLVSPASKHEAWWGIKSGASNVPANCQMECMRLYCVCVDAHRGVQRAG